MPQNIPSLQPLVIDVFTSVAKLVDIDGDAEVVQLVDSLRFLMALSELQETLQVDLEPEQVLEVLKCRTIAEVARALERLSAIGAQQQVGS